MEFWIEDFIDEDTQEVVAIERTSVIESYITSFEDIKCEIKKYKEELISAYIKANTKEFRLNKLLTSGKYSKILHGKVKKYKFIKDINII
jgi:hypothetical protein